MTATVRPARDGRKLTAILFAFVILPLVLKGVNLNISLGTEMLIMALFAMAYNILLGTTGLPSFGHAAFFGVGAYALGIAQQYFTVNLALGLVSATLAGAIAAAAVGALVMKKRGIYFGLLTLAFGQMFYIVALRWDDVTGGETGLTDVVRPKVMSLDLNNQTVMYYTVLLIVAISILLIWRITRSPFGSMLNAIKGNELRVRYLGYNPSYYKLAAMTISGAFSGLAGGLFAWHQFAVYPQTLFWGESGNVVVLTLLGGGLSSFFGPILGAVIFVGAQDVVSSYTEHWMFFFGLLFILVVTACPNGLPEAFARLYHLAARRLGNRAQRSAAPAPLTKRGR